MVSVIIPVFNAEKTLERCVDSCLSQTYNNIEILLVDDGSSDSSFIICDEYRRKDNRIHVIKKSNGGVSSARNLGIDKSNGDFIVFVDSDDWIEHDLIEKLVLAQSKNNYDYVLCNHTIYNSLHEKKAGNIYIPKLKTFEDFLVYILKDNKEHCLRSPCGRLYRTEIIKKYSIHFNTGLTLGEDTLFNYQYTSFIDSIICLNDYCGYNVWIIKNDEKINRYYPSADYVFKSRLAMYNGFVDIYVRHSLYKKYKLELMSKFIFALSIMENLAVLSKFKKNKIIIENKKIGRKEINAAKYNLLSTRNVITLFCYRYKLYNTLYYFYKIHSFRYRGKGL